VDRHGDKQSKERKPKANHMESPRDAYGIAGLLPGESNPAPTDRRPQ
jgi:hypothetical protein